VLARPRRGGALAKSATEAGRLAYSVLRSVPALAEQEDRAINRNGRRMAQVGGRHHRAVNADQLGRRPSWILS
jgi:hypothetical protein